MGDPWQSAAAAGQEQGPAAGVPGMAGNEDYIWTTLIPQQQAAAVMRQHLELAQHQTIVNPVSIMTCTGLTHSTFDVHVTLYLARGS